MSSDVIRLGGRKKSIFIDKVKEILPDGGNLNLCLTCGACSSGCPATGLEGMDPRKFLRMAALGMDDEILKSNWAWMCTMCQRCIYVCPMKIDIPQLIYNVRASWPREQRPKGILGSCDMALRNDSCSAMGASPEDFTFYEYYARWIREGKLIVNSDWNKDLKIKFTVQDPCQIVRKTYGDPIAEDLRFVVKTVAGEENFIDMQPNRSNNYCCGGGGGFLQSGLKEARLEFGRLKDSQIQATGAAYCLAGCHNCHAQIHELSDHYGGGYHVIHLWTIICLALGILGENEREYLGPDLKNVAVYGA